MEETIVSGFFALAREQPIVAIVFGFVLYASVPAIIEYLKSKKFKYGQSLSKEMMGNIEKRFDDIENKLLCRLNEPDQRWLDDFTCKFSEKDQERISDSSIHDKTQTEIWNEVFKKKLEDLEDMIDDVLKRLK